MRSVHRHRRPAVAAALFAALAMGMGCSDGNTEAATTTTSTSIVSAATTGPLRCAFNLGDRITADVGGHPCVTTFLCADGRIHVTADLGEGKRLEGFAPTDQSGTPRAHPSDAVWQEYGGEYQGSGRTKLQFDCGG